MLSKDALISVDDENLDLESKTQTQTVISEELGNQNVNTSMFSLVAEQSLGEGDTQTPTIANISLEPEFNNNMGNANNNTGTNPGFGQANSATNTLGPETGGIIGAETGGVVGAETGGNVTDTVAADTSGNVTDTVAADTSGNVTDTVAADTSGNVTDTVDAEFTDGNPGAEFTDGNPGAEFTDGIPALNSPTGIRALSSRLDCQGLSLSLAIQDNLLISQVTNSNKQGGLPVQPRLKIMYLTRQCLKIECCSAMLAGC